MPRRSPRSRRKPDRSPRVPGSSRPRSSPGKGRAGARAAARRERTGHAAARPSRRRTALSPRRSRAAAATARGTPPPLAAARPAARAARAPRAPRAGRGRVPLVDAGRVATLLEILERLYPGAKCALDHRNALELLVATMLSAQCTDERVNLVTPALFARYRSAAAFAAAGQGELETMIHSTGFFRNKARAIREACADLVARHGGEVPPSLEQLTALRGVGRKTANVVLGNAYDIPALVVDTHVTRLAGRLQLTGERDAVKIEFALMPLIPRERWTLFSHWLILHGRRVCVARKPRCSSCELKAHCPRVGVSTSE